MHRFFSTLTQFARRAAVCSLVPPPENDCDGYIDAKAFAAEVDEEVVTIWPSSPSWWFEDFIGMCKAFFVARLVMPLYTSLMGWTLTAMDMYIDGRNRLCEQPRVKRFLDSTARWLRYYNNIPMEPREDRWICCGNLLKNKYSEKYQTRNVDPEMCFSFVLSKESIHRDCMWMYRSCKEEAGTGTGVGAYHIRSMRQDMDLVVEPVPSKVRFLSVEYTHPRMDRPIPLEIPVEMYYAGNHLFTSVFVARMLAYTACKKNVVFDEEYKLHIMDKNLQYFEIDAFQWIRLDPCKTTYSVFTDNSLQ